MSSQQCVYPGRSFSTYGLRKRRLHHAPITRIYPGQHTFSVTQADPRRALDDSLEEGEVPPRAAEAAGGLAPVELEHQFVIASLATNAVVWFVLGGLTAFFFTKFDWWSGVH